MSHFKGGRRLGKIAEGRQDTREKFKGDRRFSLMMEERGAGLFETITKEAGGRQMITKCLLCRENLNSEFSV